MRGRLAALDHGRMDPVPARYTIRINGHLGDAMLSAFPALARSTTARTSCSPGSWTRRHYTAS
jgi:hypothetical protein